MEVAVGRERNARLRIDGTRNLVAAAKAAGVTRLIAQSIAFVAMLPMIIPTFLLLPVVTQPNGAFNVTEYGTVKDPALFKALHAYSPYHHVKDGVRYPAVLMLTGANDPRVDPSHSRKFTARLQAANPYPVNIFHPETEYLKGLLLYVD